MMTGWTQQRRASALAWAFLLAVLSWAFAWWVREAFRAIVFPYELDYGEGIVWEQARLLFSSAAYGPIDRFPAIVFHYPPVFHGFSAALSHLFGWDMLATGRALSLVCTGGTAVLAGVLASDLLGEGADRKARIMTGLAATLVVFTWMPVLIWSPLMRVDMMATMFAFLGVALGLRALRHEPLIYLAALSFVLAVYTKQITIAAPLALFPVLFWVRSGLAVRGLLACVTIGLVVLAGLTWATSGGFVRHIFLYNINRLDVQQLAWIPVTLYYHAAHFVLALTVLSRLRAGVSRVAGPSGAARQASAAVDPRRMAMLVLGLYWAWTTLLSLAVAKSGASVNYLIEWTCVTSVLVGLALDSAARLVTAGETDGTPASILATCIAPLALGLQVVALHGFVPLTYERAWTPDRIAENEVISTRIRAADKPIISDNMVLLVRNRRPVLWEPAIFAELASVGMWDEGPLVNRIRSGEFAMFITVGTRGSPLFDSRYNPLVAEAIDAVYPVKKSVVVYTLHLPAGS